MKILIAGDFVPQYRTANQIESGDYSCLAEIKPIIQKSDYSIVNFESPVVTREAKPIAKTGPRLRCTERAMECLAQAGFNCVALANNHFRDYGQVGVEDTLAACNKYRIDHVGGGVNLAEAQQILYKDIDGQRLAIVNVCENEWSIAGKNYGGSAPTNPVWNYYTIQEARKQSDYVLVIVHGGIEGYQYPTPRMVDTYRFFIDAGADAVVNHHQHCYSGYEEYMCKPIFYGVGNFCFDRSEKRNTYWNEGYMVMIHFATGMTKYEAIPYTQCDKEPAVILMHGEKKKEFDDIIKEINLTIGSVEKLESQMNNIALKKGKNRLQQIEPSRGMIVRKLQKWGVMPSLNNEKKIMTINNVIRCESHRELLLKFLTNGQ